MGKKKSFYKKQLKPFLKSNGTLLAVLAGATSGIAIASIFGTEKAKEILQTVEDNIKDFNKKVANGINKESVS
ncbi:MAG TPA: hypothetical protein VK589_10705 [Chryseolinea sp.]|nr:hypothetical protein [Chryseolinea sp.]